MTPLYILLHPQASSEAADLAHGMRARVAAALFTSGVDVFVPNEVLGAPGSDPRVAIGGASGRSLTREGLNPMPTGFVSLELAGTGAQMSGSLEMIDGLDLRPRVRVEFEGDALDLVEFFDEALEALAAEVGVEIPVRWPVLLDSEDPEVAADGLAIEGKQLRAEAAADDAGARGSKRMTN